MRDVVTEATRKRGVFFKTFTVVVVICILCSQLFVVWKIQDKYRKGGDKGKSKGTPAASSTTTPGKGKPLVHKSAPGIVQSDQKF